jgi:hypothetical protein
MSNGLPLMVNVLGAGLGGFVFWIVTARSVPPAVVAQASAMVSAMFGVAQLSQQHWIANLPQLITASPRPRRVAGLAYAMATASTAIVALGYVVIGPHVASGLTFLSDPELTAVFLAGCVAWSWFSLQDAALAGVRQGRLVLAENTVWSLARLGMVVAFAAAGLELSVARILGTWLLPAAVLVAVVSTYLFVGPGAALAAPRGHHTFERKTLFTHMGFEHLAAIASGVATIVLPAVALSTLGATRAAPFLAAYSILLVLENALGSFVAALTVELRRSRSSSRPLLLVTAALLAAMCVVAIVGALLFADDLMGLFGAEYRGPGAEVLMVLVLGLPAQSLWLLSISLNRVNAAGVRNFMQQLAYTTVLLATLMVAPIDGVTGIAWCVVAARWAAALVSAVDQFVLRRRTHSRQAMVMVV